MNDDKISQSSFVGHLTELRSRLVKSIIYFFIFFVICYLLSENIYSFLVQPYADAVKDDVIQRRLIYTALHETFITYLKVAFFSSIFITSPIILTQIWKFALLLAQIDFLVRLSLKGLLAIWLRGSQCQSNLKK